MNEDFLALEDDPEIPKDTPMGEEDDNPIEDYEDDDDFDDDDEDEDSSDDDGSNDDKDE